MSFVWQLEDWGKLIGDVPAATAILDRFLPIKRTRIESSPPRFLVRAECEVFVYLTFLKEGPAASNYRGAPTGLYG